MRIRDVMVPVRDLESAATYFRDVLELPTVRRDAFVVIDVGTTTLTLAETDSPVGAYHLAFDVDKRQFGDVVEWLRTRVSPLVVGESDVVDGPEGWRSQSLYFIGPDGMVLEAITREDAAPRHQDGRFSCISEIGLGVTDVPTARRAVERALGVSPYFVSSPAFEPLGDHDGLLIVVDQGRTWFPTQSSVPGPGNVTAMLESSGSLTRLRLRAGVLDLHAD